MEAFPSSSIQKSSERLRRVVTVLCLALSVLLVLERFGRLAMEVAIHGLSQGLFKQFLYKFVTACPEVLYLMSLWWVRQALATFARGDLYAPTVTRMLKRVGAALAAGATLNVFVVPAVDRALGFGPGYWVAFDVSGLVLGAIGLSLAIVARVLYRAGELKAELDEMF